MGSLAKLPPGVVARNIKLPISVSGRPYPEFEPLRVIVAPARGCSRNQLHGPRRRKLPILATKAFAIPLQMRKFVTGKSWDVVRPVP